MYNIFNLPEHIKNNILSYTPLWWMPSGTIVKIKTKNSLIKGVVLYNCIWNTTWFYHSVGCFTLNSNLLIPAQKKLTLIELI